MARKPGEKDYVYWVRIYYLYTYYIIDSLPLAGENSDKRKYKKMKSVSGTFYTTQAQ
jgi:hypothetical protein